MIVVTGLGPGDIEHIPAAALEILLDPARTVIVRTEHHPAASQIAKRRAVVFCDDLYETEATFEAVYEAIADRVITAADHGDVVYAVPGSPFFGEFAVREIMRRSDSVDVLPSESFVDAVLRRTGYDPFERGLQLLNGHDLPHPLIIDKPTIIGHLDRPEVLADVAADLSRVLPEDAKVRVLAGLGSRGEVDVEVTLDEIDHAHAGFRTSLWVDAEPGGLAGAVRAMTVLRDQCPWDREQTHESLTKYLVEEAYELIDAVGELTPDDHVAYARVEDELGDVLLQVLFQSAIAAEVNQFDIDDVAEVLRRKLVRRHPHVFGDVEVADAAEVKSNWDRIKERERGGPTGSTLDGIPAGLPALHRAAKVMNRARKAGMGDLVPLGDHEAEPDALGEELLRLVSISATAGIDPELALRAATARLEERLRRLEGEALGDRSADMQGEGG